MYATTTTGYHPNVSKSKDTKVLQALSINNNYVRLIQTITSTTEQWVGLSYTDANNLCIASESSSLNGITRNYLGSAVIQIRTGTVTQWARIDGCWGTIITTQIQRMGDTNCYQVSRTTQVLEVTNSGGTMGLL